MSKFFYEHIGHMQFSELTVSVYTSIERIGGENSFVEYEQLVCEVVKCGFSEKLARSEIDRFCYGFECQEKILNGIRVINLTNIGKMFRENLFESLSWQGCHMAIIVKKSKRTNCRNIVLQESTFFSEELYNLVSKYKLRKGPARDFLKCMSITEINEFLEEWLALLSVSESCFKNNWEQVRKMIRTNGKSWKSIGCKYSWFVYPQKYQLDFSLDDFKKYQLIVKNLIRPPEWGGGKYMSKDELVKIIGLDFFEKSLENGIIRQVWTVSKRFKGNFTTHAMTAVGYLMWERYEKGFLHEYLYVKTGEEKFKLSFCRAYDLTNKSSFWRENTNSVPFFEFCGNRKTVIDKSMEQINSGVTLF